MGASDVGPTNHVLVPRDVNRGVADVATIWYTLSPTNAAPVAFEVRDRIQRVVTRAQGAMSGQGARASLIARKELNRFDWNLRYDPPFHIPSGVGLFAALQPGFAGPKAPPGSYDVTVSSGGWKETQTLTVRPDPHASAAQADYDDQLEFALQVGARTRTLYEMVLTNRKLQAQVTAILEQPAAARNAAVSDRRQKMLRGLRAIEEALAKT